MQNEREGFSAREQRLVSEQGEKGFVVCVLGPLGKSENVFRSVERFLFGSTEVREFVGGGYCGLSEPVASFLVHCHYLGVDALFQLRVALG